MSSKKTKKEEERNSKISKLLRTGKKFFSGSWVSSGVIGYGLKCAAAGASFLSYGASDIALLAGTGLLLYSGVRVAGNAAEMIKDEALDVIDYKPEDPDVKLLTDGKNVKRTSELVGVVVES